MLEGGPRIRRLDRFAACCGSKRVMEALIHWSAGQEPPARASISKLRGFSIFLLAPAAQRRGRDDFGPGPGGYPSRLCPGNQDRTFRDFDGWVLGLNRIVNAVRQRPGYPYGSLAAFFAATTAIASKVARRWSRIVSGGSARCAGPRPPTSSPATRRFQRSGLAQRHETGPVHGCLASADQRGHPHAHNDVRPAPAIRPLSPGCGLPGHRTGGCRRRWSFTSVERGPACRCARGAGTRPAQPPPAWPS